jgi:hypothetical protein
MNERATRRLARGIGLAYLVNVIVGIFSLIYVPSLTTGHGDAAATVRNILAHEALFRAGIVAGLFCYVEFILLPLLFYRLLGAVNRHAAVLMVVLALLGVPLSIASLQHKLDVLTLLGHTPWLDALGMEHLQTQVMLQLSAYDHALLLAQVFWGLWLIPLGWLVMRSGMLPRVLGVVLMLGGLSYLADFVGQMMIAGYDASVLSDYMALPAALGEIGTCLWLLVAGARPLRTTSLHPATVA